MSATQGDTIQVTIADLSIAVKPLFQGPAHELAGAKVSAATTGAVSLLGLQVPVPAIEVFQGGIHITKAGDVTVGVNELLGMHVHENVHLGGTVATTVVNDLRAVIAGAGSPLTLVTDLLGAVTNNVSHLTGGVLG